MRLQKNSYRNFFLSTRKKYFPSSMIRIIVEKFSKSVLSLAVNLNYETQIASFPPFGSNMSNSCESSIFLEDCNEQEISGITINDVNNSKGGKAYKS